ncbi:MAG: carboxypeptidase-like regulatory domain-containing protein, partial [Algoriphagus sp.]
MRNSTTTTPNSISCRPESKNGFGNLLLGSLLFLFLITSGLTVAQTAPLTVTGTVIDSDGLSLPGLTILVKGTATGTVTDSDGKYSIKVSGPEAVLAFSYIGYQSQEVTVGNRTVIDLVMEEDI